MARKIPKINVRKLVKMVLRGNQRLNVGFQLYGHEIPGWVMVKKKVRGNREGLRLSTYIYEPTDSQAGDKRLKFELIEGMRAGDAPDLMQRVVDQVMSNHLLGPGESVGIELGDGSIVNTTKAGAGEMLDFLVFSRSNFTGKFNSIGSVPISMVEFAAGLDGFVATGVENTNYESAIEIEVSLDRKRMRVGEILELKYKRVEDTGASNWWFFLANTDHCELFRDATDRVFFRPDRVGKVDLLVMNLDEQVGRSVVKESVLVLP